MRFSLVAISAVFAAGLAAADEITTQTSQSTEVSSTTVSAAPAAAPVENQDLAGTVQSVDRRNQSLVLQDADGKNIGVSFNRDWHVYRRGEEIQYRDIEPNDHVVLRYRAES